MGQKTPEVPEYLEVLEYLISCFLGLCSLGYLAFVSWLPVFFLFSLITYRNVFTQAQLCQRIYINKGRPAAFWLPVLAHCSDGSTLFGA